MAGSGLRKILAIGAHADDTELGCGGSLLKWAAEGHAIAIHVATDSAYATPDATPVRMADVAAREAAAAAERLGARLSIGAFPCLSLAGAGNALNMALVALIEAEKPDVVLTHWDGDSHCDHRALALAVLHAARRVPTLLAFRSNWYPGSRPFDPRLAVDIGATLNGKVELIGLFASENSRTKGAWEAQVRHEAALLGHAHGVESAEGFEVLKARF